MSRAQPKAHACAHPNCKAPGIVQLATGKAFYCFAHKPVGRMK